MRFHLDRLVAEGVVARHVEDRTEPGRPRLIFTAAGPPGLTSGTHGDKQSYRLLAAILASFVSGSLLEWRVRRDERGVRADTTELRSATR